MVSSNGLQKGEKKERTENLNSKTLFYKDCSLGSVKNQSNYKSLLSYWWVNIKLQASEREREREREREENKCVYIRKLTKKENLEVNVNINTDENEI